MRECGDVDKMIKRKNNQTTHFFQTQTHPDFHITAPRKYYYTEEQPSKFSSRERC